MNREDFIAVASRLFSIYSLFGIIRTVPSAGQMFSQERGAAWAGLYAAVLIISLLFCAILWFFPLTIARKLLPVMREPRSDEPMGSSTALSLGLTLIGAWFLASALVDASYWLTLFVRSKQITDIPFEWTHMQIASIIATAFELVISLCLILGSSGIRRLIYKFRYGGI